MTYAGPHPRFTHGTIKTITRLPDGFKGVGKCRVCGRDWLIPDGHPDIGVEFVGPCCEGVSKGEYR